MSSIAQLVSEIAHSVKQPNSVPVRRAIKLSIIHARNNLIRKSFSNHNYSDKVLQQRFRVSLIDVPDGDVYGSEGIITNTIKRTANKVPRPVRLTNNLPFHSVRTVGVTNPHEIAFVKEASAKFYNSLPGMCPVITYDYINEYIYVNIQKGSVLNNLDAIVIESIFEYPHIIETETVEGKLDINAIDDNDEFLLPEDMIDAIKQIVLETWNKEIIRNTNEVPAPNIVS
nr:MAG TPA: Structural protein [Crassvirales sp.]